MIGAIQTGPHSFGGHIMAGANLLMDSLAPGAIIEFSAPTGSGIYRVMAQAAKWMDGASFICRHKEIGEQFGDHVAELSGRCRCFSFAYASLHLDEVTPLCPFVIFANDLRWDSIVQSVAEEFCAKGCVVIRMK